MKDEQDDRWIGKIKELLEDYSPSDAPGDWKQVKRRINRNLSWSAWLLLSLKKPWIYAFIFGAGILAGYLLFYSPDKMEVSQVKTAAVENPLVKPSETSKTAEVKSAAAAKTEQSFLRKEVLFGLVMESKSGPPAQIIADTISKGQEKAINRTDNISSAKIEDTAAPVTRTDSIKKLRKPVKTLAFALNGDPWKVGIGYDYLYMIQPDTGKGILHELSVHLDKQVTPKLWVGSGFTFGRTLVTRSAKFWVRDWSKTDSLGQVYLRDSSVFYQRWQNHITIPLRATYDLFRNRTFAIPVSAGAALGWAYYQDSFFSNDGFSIGSYGGATDRFTGFITADFSLGYEIFYLRGLSAVLSAEYRRMLIGNKSYGFGQNFIGYKIVLNLDFDKGKWR